MSISDDILIENFNTPVSVDDLEVGKCYRLQHRYNATVNYLAVLDRKPNSGYAGWVAPGVSDPLDGQGYHLSTSYYNYFEEDPVAETEFHEGDTVRLTHREIEGHSFTGEVLRDFTARDGNIKLRQPGSLWANAYIADEFEIELIERAASPLDQFRKLPIGSKFRMNLRGSTFVKVSETHAVNIADYFEPTDEHFSFLEKVD